MSNDSENNGTPEPTAVEATGKRKRAKKVARKPTRAKKPAKPKADRANRAVTGEPARPGGANKNKRKVPWHPHLDRGVRNRVADLSF